MDEPTSSLSAAEVKVLFKIMRELLADGISIVYISHRLEEIMEIGDHVTLSFYANNFFNNFGHVKSLQTGQKTSLFNSGYIPKFYYGLSLRVKI